LHSLKAQEGVISEFQQKFHKTYGASSEKFGPSGVVCDVGHKVISPIDSLNNMQLTVMPVDAITERVDLIEVIKWGNSPARVSGLFPPRKLNQPRSETQMNSM
jgi:hypothetical protein